MAVQSYDRDLKDLLAQVCKGELQLPEFQRSWVWDDGKICKLIESITMGFPMGAVMFLETGGEVNYKPRLFTGVDEQYKNVAPEYLVLDGQQRLTTLFQVFMGKNAVETCFEKNKNTTIYRYYYLDIKKALNETEDREEAIISISDKKIKTSDIGKVIDLDLRTREDEYKNLMFPLNLMFSSNDYRNWERGLSRYYDNSPEITDLIDAFYDKIVNAVNSYKLPVITVLKSTSQSSVCQIFENVNRGGVPLNVFELVTASLAAEGVELRQEWNKIRAVFTSQNHDLLNEVSGTDFITAMTLWDSYEQSLIPRTDGKAIGVKCKKKDVMNLRRAVFVAKQEGLTDAFMEAARFLIGQGIFSAANLPYNTQYIPLAAIYAYDNRHRRLLHNRQMVINKLSRWYWCGVLGELYGAANETRYALDIRDFFAWVEDDSAIPDTVARSNFQATRLLSLQTRNSAAYKGIMALILQDEPLDFATTEKMSIATYTNDSIDIHHIFPANHCEKAGLPSKKWNSVVNKTMISATTNRTIGGVAPSEYIQKLFRKNNDTDSVVKAIGTHKIDFDLLNADKFDEFINDRAMKLLDRIEQATGKSVAGRDSQETIEAYGQSLTNPQTSPANDTDENN